MNEAKQNLAAAVRDARTGLGLSQEKLAEILNIDSRTIRGIEAGRGNPKFEKLYPLVTYLKIPANKIFDPAYKEETPNLQKLLALQKDCTEQEAADLIIAPSPMVTPAKIAASYPIQTSFPTTISPLLSHASVIWLTSSPHSSKKMGNG